MHKCLSILTVAMLAAMPTPAHTTVVPACRTSAMQEPIGYYPDHQLSPRQSLRAFDTVFLGEVVVASRSCSLGYCAGIKVLKTVKGRPGPTVLIRVAGPGPEACTPATFATKGLSWLIFANQGTSRGGQMYLDVNTDGPSFMSSQVPDFNKLEGEYKLTRARLDAAIGDRLSTWR